jgi:hypothetical protein
MYKPFLMASLFVMIVGLACSFGGSDPTAVSVPTLPPATEIPPATLVPPTQAAAPTLAPPTESVVLPTQSTGGENTGSGSVQLDPNLYTHASGLFSINPPLGWNISEDDGSASFEAPDTSGFVYLQVTNTGYELDDPSFERFVRAREDNFFADFDAYAEQSYEVDASINLGTAGKELSFDGIPQTVLSAYIRQGAAIYALDLWAESDKFDDYQDGYLAMFDTLLTDPTNIANQVLYNWIFDFTGPGSLFEIKVPVTWRYTTDLSDTAVIDTFFAPDEHALIQNIAFDDGTEVSKNDAGQFALNLLNNLYSDNITITDDTVQSDGSERLTWFDGDGGYSGISFFETRGTTFLLFTVLWDDPFEDIYFDALDFTISSYGLP